METLKKFFPLSFKYADTVANLIIGILIYIVAGFIGGVLLGIVGIIPVVGILVGIIGGLVNIYVVAGIIIEILVFAKVLK